MKNTRSGLLALLVTAAVAGGSGIPVLRAAQPSNAPAEVYQGIDVSADNGKVSWANLKKNPQLEYVYVKATDGKNGVDPMFKKNSANARKSGLKIGYYHHFTTDATVMTQFEHFKSTVKPGDMDIYPAVYADECKKWKGSQFKENLMWMLTMMTNYYGGAVLYCDAKFYNKNCAPELNTVMTLLSLPGKKEPVMKGASDGEACVIWQFSEKGVIKGVQTPVNLNAFTEGRDLGWITIRKDSTATR